MCLCVLLCSKDLAKRIQAAGGGVHLAKEFPVLRCWSIIAEAIVIFESSLHIPFGLLSVVNHHHLKGYSIFPPIFNTMVSYSKRSGGN